MAFDLKKDWSTADVSSLLGSVEDDRSWRLEVTNDGLAQLNDLSTIPDAAYEERLHCFFEIWDQGTDFVGPGAASDASLCKKLQILVAERFLFVYVSPCGRLALEVWAQLGFACVSGSQWANGSIPILVKRG